MGRGPKKHLKRLNAPSHWMLNKMGGTWAPKPSGGPHKTRECLPLIIILRNRLKYALTGKEVDMIVLQKLIKVDGKIRTDKNFPAGFMDVISIDRTNEHYRLLYDMKGRFFLNPISARQTKFKLGKVKKVTLGAKGIPFLVTHDGRTIRYPDPDIKVNDTVKIDLATGKITEFIKFEINNLVMVTGGKNIGRVGILDRREKHAGSFETVHVRDAAGQKFATRLGNVFIIGTRKAGDKHPTALVAMPRRKVPQLSQGIKLTILEQQALRTRLAAKRNAKK